MFKINDSYLPIYAKFFSRSIILEFLYKKEPKFIIETLKNSSVNTQEISSLRYKDLFDKVYDRISKGYLCEYVYKNETLYHEILSNRHKDEAKLLSEVAVGGSKADIVVINGTTTVYEIKTELDTVNRLESQLDDYVKVFDRINILTCESKLKSINEILSTKPEYSVIGIYLLKKSGRKNILDVFKESSSNLENIDVLYVHNTINFSEFRKYYPHLDKETFIKLEKSEVHHIFSDIIRHRAKHQDFLHQMPKSLKMVGSVLQKLNKKEKAELISKLENYVTI